METLQGSLKVEGNGDSNKLKKPKSVKEQRLEIWTSIVNDWKNREKVPFHGAKIAKKLGVARSTVTMIIRRFKERGEVKLAPQTGRKRTETSESWKTLTQILEQEPTLTANEVARRVDVTRYVARRMMKEYRFGVRDKVEKGPSSKKFQEGTSACSSVSDTGADKDGDGGDNNCGWEGDDEDLQGNVNRAPCFICDAVAKNNVLDSTFPTGREISSVPAEVETSVGVIFFLRDVLGMKDANLESVMKEARGKNPDAWEISVCTDPGCGGAVERSFVLWKEIKKLEAELKQCRKGILERIRSRCSTERERTGIIQDDDQALLKSRVRERVKMGMTEPDSLEFQESPGKIQVKVEPEDEEFNDLDDFTTFGDPSYDDECDLKDVKLEADDNGARCRRSSRRKRKTNKFKFGELVSSSNRRSGLGTVVPKGKSKLKVTRGSKKRNMEDETASVRSNEKMYTCQSCPALEEMDKDKFIAHLAFHSSSLYKCTECNFHFQEDEGNDQVQKHWAERHPGSDSSSAKVVQVPAALAAGKIWACSGRNCSELFRSTEERDRHELLVHGIPEPKATFRCSTCSLQFRDMTELRFHRAIEHPQDATLTCCYCSIQFEVKSEKEDIKFLNMDQLKTHISQKHPDQLFINAQGERIKTTAFLETCPICGLVFSLINYSKLDYHIVREHGHKLHETFSCPVCPRKMRYADAWKHLKLRHWPDAPASYSCRFCGKGFRKPFNRNEHEQIHKNKDTRPYQCDLCGSSFAVRQYLKIHQRVSHEHRPFPSALKKKQSRKNVQVLSESSESSKVTPSVVEPAGPIETFPGHPALQDLLCG